ncbi:MAG: hypothetical protein QOF76_1026 [Solirubrobacteraceae bacterium]|jgi:hypothetical protein|nr:hypothetical protein [Solirubrobacteraceae bacterium]
MDNHLKLLADASLQAAEAEEALDSAAFHTAVDRLDEVAAKLAELRERWPAMSAGERAVLGPGASAVRARVDAGRARVPKLSALSVGTAVNDPEEDTEPPG